MSSQHDHLSYPFYSQIEMEGENRLNGREEVRTVNEIVLFTWIFLINMLQPFASHLIVELRAIMTKVATIIFFISRMFFHRHKTTRTKLHSAVLRTRMIFWQIFCKTFQTSSSCVNVKLVLGFCLTQHHLRWSIDSRVAASQPRITRSDKTLRK